MGASRSGSINQSINRRNQPKPQTNQHDHYGTSRFPLRRTKFRLPVPAAAAAARVLAMRQQLAVYSVRILFGWIRR